MPPVVVVVVSPSVDVRSQLRMTLWGERFDVVEVGDLDEAIMEVALRPPRVLVLDEELPGSSASSFAHALRDRTDGPGVRTLLLTRRRPLAGVPDGFDSCLALPATSMALLRRIEALAEDG